jgi:hypothetical protein
MPLERFLPNLGLGSAIVGWALSLAFLALWFSSPGSVAALLVLALGLSLGAGGFVLGSLCFLRRWQRARSAAAAILCVPLALLAAILVFWPELVAKHVAL